MAMPTWWGIAPAAEYGWYQFSSRHSTVVQWAWGDASIRGIRFKPVQAAFNNPWSVMMEVSGRQDAGQRDVAIICD